jgi:VWFA-related protein
MWRRWSTHAAIGWPIVLLLAGIATLVAQDRPQPPTFRSATNLVVVDAIVTDQQGRFVSDLTKDDFQIFEDGKPQALATFSLVDVPIESTSAATRPTVDPDVVSNGRPLTGRVYVLAFDDRHISAARTERVRQQARQFIERNLADNDVMAVVYTSHTERGQEFTNNRQLLLASVDRLMGDSLRSAALAVKDDADAVQGVRPPADPLALERIDAARRTLEALKTVSESLAAIEGRRKALLLFGDGIDVDIMNPLEPRLIFEARDAFAAAARANVAIYGIHSLGLTGVIDEGIANNTRASVLSGMSRLMEQNLQVLADQTGGFAAIRQNDFTDAYARVVREMSSYYLVAYQPANERDGVAHTIQVRVTRPGLTVRARQGYESRRAAATANSLATPSAVLSETLASALPVTGLTFDVFAAPFRNTSRQAAVLLGIEVPAAALTLGRAGTVELSYVAVDAQGKIRATDSNTIALDRISAATRQRIERTGVRALNRLELPPGRYQLRVAAYETAGGTRGSVLYDLDVPDFSDRTLTMSGIAITSMTVAEQPTPRFDDRLKNELRSVLPGPPGARRTFARSDEMAAFVEAYTGSGSKATTLTITTTLTAATGAVVFQADQPRNVVGARCQVALRLPLKDLAPGTYTLTFTADTVPPTGKRVARDVRVSVADR